MICQRNAGALSAIPRVLHITNWYPNPWHPLEGIFIKKQIDLFSSISKGFLVNVQVRPGPNLLAFRHLQYSKCAEGYYCLTKIGSGRAIEILTTLLLIYVLCVKNANKFNFIHIHIAYPLLRHFGFWKHFVKPKIVISEHWSAYHFNFGLQQGSRALKRIRRVFSHKVPLISVSQALAADIQKFAGAFDFETYVLPNVVPMDDRDRFPAAENGDSTPTLFTVNLWREIKEPFSMLSAVCRINARKQRIRFVVGGDGPLLDKMRFFVADNGRDSGIEFMGRMNEIEITSTLRKSDVYLFSSRYETFSVACAHALCCGTPIMGPRIPAIMEYVGERDHVPVDENNEREWVKAISYYLSRRHTYNRQDIASRAQSKFAPEKILSGYIAILNMVGRSS